MPLLELSFASGERSLSVRRFVVNEAVSSLFEVSVWARSPDSSVDLSALVGQPAALRIESGYKFAHRPGRLWAGVCAFAAQVDAEPAPNLSTYQVKIVPLLWLLTKRSGHRIFQHLSIPDIIDKLLAEWTITPAWEIDRGRYPKLELKVQYGESDYTFFCRLLEEAGITFLFEDGDDDTQLVLRDEPQARPIRPDPLPYFEHANQAAEREFVTNTRIGCEVRPGAFILRDYDFRRPMLVLAEEAPKAAPPEDRNEQVRYEPGSYLAEIGAGGGTPNADDKGVARYDVGYGKAQATRLLAGARAGKQAVTFDTNAIDVRPGTLLTFSGHAHPDAGRPLLATHFSMEGSPTEAWHMTAHAVPAEIPYRPPAITPKPVVHGIQSATVVGVKNQHETQEIHVDEFGRVRVQLPWDRDGKADDFACCWIRVSQGWAGKAYGFMTIPRVGQEVIVTFLDGDPDQPVITGRLYNQVNPLPYPLPEHKTISTWKSDSSPGSNGFNEIKFEDRKGQELFYHQAEKNQRVLVKNNETITVARNRRKDVARMETDTTGVNRTEVTGANRSEMTAVLRTTLVGANRGRWVKGHKGVMNQGHRQLLGMKTIDIIVAKDKRERLQRDAHLYVKGDRREQVEDDRSFVVVEDHHEKIDGSFALASGKTSSYHADETLTGEAGTGVTAKGPGGFVAIDAGGVTISGTLVRINAGGSAGEARQAKPARTALAKELKQPKDAKVAVDERGDVDMAALQKHLAAVAKEMKGKSGVTDRKWGRSKVVGGRKVFQRDDLIDPDARDKSGRTNLQRMKRGLAPLGPDGKSVNLHHLIQSESGSIAEISGSFHKDYHKVIHINPPTIPSGIDRKKFRAWRRDYWKERAGDFEGGAS
ncbi:MAG: type VI secretion system tip protein VgrG [Polyangiaceae bacterium]|nr:type VI secretion system tip protein VgrG [Polyangiaceae bacterium]